MQIDRCPSLHRGLHHLKDVFRRNNYKESVVQNVLDQHPKISNLTATGEKEKIIVASIPYMKGTSEVLARIF